MKRKYFVIFLVLSAQMVLAQKFPMPNQNVQDAFSLASSIFSGYQGQKTYQNKINALATISSSISDPEMLVREYTSKMNQLQKEAEERKKQKAAELEKQIDLIKKGIEKLLQNSNVDLGPLGNLMKDAVAGVTKQVAIANANKKIEELKQNSERELDAEMKKSMNAIFDKVTKENLQAQHEYLVAAAQVYSEKDERNYIEYYRFYNCTYDYMKKNYNYKTADWLKTNCIAPPKNYFGYSQQSPRFEYSRYNQSTDFNKEPVFSEFNPEDKIKAIDEKLKVSMSKIDDLIKTTDDAFQKGEYLALRQQLVDKANKEKENIQKGEHNDKNFEQLAEISSPQQQPQYQPLLDCAIRKLSLFNNEMPFPEFLESAKVYAEAELSENKRNPNAYIFLADLTEDVVDRYMLTGYALYLNKNNFSINEKFKSAKNSFGSALFSAIEKGENEFVSKSLNQNLIDGFEYQGKTPFQFAITKDNPEIMEKLMPKNIDKYALLYNIIEWGGVKVTKQLLRSININSIPVVNGYDPLLATVSFDKKDIAFVLLEQGFEYPMSLELASDFGKTFQEKTASMLALYAVSKNNGQMLAEVVLETPALIKSKIANVSVVDFIVQENKPNLLAILVKHGLDVSVQQYSYLLELAINSDSEDIAIKLVNLGINTTIRPESGGTYVNLVAAKKNQYNLFNVLIQKGISLSERNNQNELAVMTTMRSGDVTKTRVLLEKGASVDFSSKLSGNQIHWVMENKISPEFLSLLSMYKIDINQKDKNGDNPLMVALKYKLTNYIPELLSCGANISMPNHKSVTPLQYAIYSHSAQFTMLLSKCDNPNIQGINGWTALHFAVRENDIESVRQLLNSNANPLIIDAWGRTPYRIAKEYGREEIRKVLAKKMGYPNIVKTAYVFNKKNAQTQF